MIFLHQTKIVLFLQLQNRNVPWCNGSTADFGSAGSGSSPGGTTFLTTDLLQIGGFFYSRNPG